MCNLKYVNTVPSLIRNDFEGVTTRTYNLSEDMVMKFVHSR